MRGTWRVCGGLLDLGGSVPLLEQVQLFEAVGRDVRCVAVIAHPPAQKLPEVRACAWRETVSKRTAELGAAGGAQCAVVSGHAHPVLILGVWLARNGKVTEDLGDRKDGRGHAGRRRNDDRSPRQVQRQGGPRLARWSGGVSRPTQRRSGIPGHHHPRNTAAFANPLEVEAGGPQRSVCFGQPAQGCHSGARNRNRGKQDARHRRSRPSRRG